jgi:hypothetical protein
MNQDDDGEMERVHMSLTGLTKNVADAPAKKRETMMTCSNTRRSDGLNEPITIVRKIEQHRANEVGTVVNPVLRQLRKPSLLTMIILLLSEGVNNRLMKY